MEISFGRKGQKRPGARLLITSRRASEALFWRLEGYLKGVRGFLKADVQFMPALDKVAPFLRIELSKITHGRFPLASVKSLILGVFAHIPA